jgi:hypothetical protein
MPRIRMALVLPIVQVLAASILLFWGSRVDVTRGCDPYVPTQWLICRGLNAPALLVGYLDPLMWGETWLWTRDWLPNWAIFSFPSRTFLLGVAALWYFAGRAIDRRQTPSPVSRFGLAATLVVQPLLLALGGLVLVVGLHELRRAHCNPNPVGALLMLTWSAMLILLSGRALVRRLYQAQRKRLA